MTLSDFRRITDELLSAYIDGQVTEQERAFIEAAIAQDQEIAWRLSSLRQTVTLLRDLPELALPRSFALTLDQLQMAQPSALPAETEAISREAGVIAREMVAAPAPRMARQSVNDQPRPMGLGERLAAGWREFWQAGNPLLRNAAAVSFALMLFLAGSGQLLNRAMQPMGSMAVVSDAAPASESAASESVAMVPAPAATPSPQSTPVQAQAEVAASKEPEADEAAEGTAQEPADAPLSRQAPTDTTTESAPLPTAGEEAAAAAMAAPDQPEQSEESAPMMEMPIPGVGAGIGAGGMGGGGDGMDAPQNGAGDSSLFPEQAYQFDVDRLAEPTVVPAEEAVSVSVAAASAEEPPPASAAAIASTPAVDPPVAAAAAVSAASDVAVTDTTTETANGASADEASENDSDSAAARSAAPAEVTSGEAATEESEAAQAEVETSDTEEADTEEAVIEDAAEPTSTPTPEAIAVLAPSTITSSAVVEIVQPDSAQDGSAQGVQDEGVVSMTSYGFNLPVVWIAQGSALLLTVVLASLWWRSRTPRRPRG